MTLNSYCYKKSIEFILGSCKWLDINEMIKFASIKFINNLVVSKKPGELYSMLKFGKRSCSNISFYYFPKTSGFKSTLLYRGIMYYNQLPNELKYLPKKKFSKQFKSERHILKQLSD